MHSLSRCTLALIGAFVLAATDAANAQKRPARNPPAPLERPYVREPGCHTTYDSSGFAQPDYLNPNCENAFRRLYPPR